MQQSPPFVDLQNHNSIVSFSPFLEIRQKLPLNFAILAHVKNTMKLPLNSKSPKQFDKSI